MSLNSASSESKSGKNPLAAMQHGVKVGKSKGKKNKKDKAKDKNNKDLPEFDKYYYYHNSVQSPDQDVKFFRKVYKEINGSNPQTLREDFCGTFQICCEWTKLDSNFQAHGVDLDDEPIEYGYSHHYQDLKKSQKERIQIHKQNVLDPLPDADIAVAVNFSYFIFKERQTMKAYFQNVYNSLRNKGVFILDCFGGPDNCAPNEEETEYTDLKYSYFWDQDAYDPITNEALFYIHFKRKGEKKREKVFTYDWRMWSIPELRDILSEVGFKNTHVYWEGTDKDGEGDGVYKKTQTGEDCDTWICYIVGEK